MRDIRKQLGRTAIIGVAALLAGCMQDKNAPATTAAAPSGSKADAAAMDGATGKDWPTYHGTWKSFHFSSLDQINSGNVQNLQVAWTHDPGRNTRGLQSMPLAQDGILYYSGSYSFPFSPSAILRSECFL